MLLQISLKVTEKRGPQETSRSNCTLMNMLNELDGLIAVSYLNRRLLTNPWLCVKKTTANKLKLLSLENMLNSELRVYNYQKLSWRERAPVPLADACYARPNTVERESFEGEKFCAIRAKVSPQNLGGVASFCAAKASNPRKFSPRKSYFSPICESFLPRKFPAQAVST